ncbi:hypothetical protein HCQ94_02040 [Actinomyces sp. zg-332]|uniref:hypothetical protein n=1 Tax=Actinomyces sp. zg-332 TaxID=2708340 RepID=UPI0014217E2E|nr:hypothetical protein [Actinomyces sp. zg-332]QPK94509.1 hypothetical protein HCQ94_02040 [Actinomyces sp. zg-332]
MKVFCISNNVSKECIDSFVAGWCLGEKETEFEVYNFDIESEKLRKSLGKSVRNLSCEEFLDIVSSSVDKKDSVEEKTNESLEIKDTSKTTFTSNVSFITSCCSVEDDGECDTDFSAFSSIYWLDDTNSHSRSYFADLEEDNKDNVAYLGNKDNEKFEYVNHFCKWIDEYFENSDLSDKDKASFLYRVLKNIDTSTLGVYRNSDFLVSNAEDKLPFSYSSNSFSENSVLGSKIADTSPQKSSFIPLKSVLNSGVINELQKLSKISRASIQKGSNTPIGFLLSILGIKLVDERNFVLQKSKAVSRITENDLVILFEKDLNLLSVDSTLLPILKKKLYHTIVPLVVVSQKMELSRVELNEYHVNSSYEARFTNDDLYKLGSALSVTWKL